jgi:hypothetical protein
VESAAEGLRFRSCRGPRRKTTSRGSHDEGTSASRVLSKKQQIGSGDKQHHAHELGEFQPDCPLLRTVHRRFRDSTQSLGKRNPFGALLGVVFSNGMGLAIEISLLLYFALTVFYYSYRRHRSLLIVNLILVFGAFAVLSRRLPALRRAPIEMAQAEAEPPKAHSPDLMRSDSVLLGDLEYDRGRYRDARKAYERAVQQGSTWAAYRLGYLLAHEKGGSSNGPRAVSLLQKAYSNGMVVAAAMIGAIYHDGSNGIPPDYRRSLFWFQRAADEGDGYSQAMIGLMYDRGQGVRQNYYWARRYYITAIQHDQQQSIYNLGLMYEFGRGIPADLSPAVALYQNAAARGIQSAIQRLKELGVSPVESLSPGGISTKSSTPRMLPGRIPRNR